MIKRIETGGIGWLEPLRGSSEWLYGSDYTDGDLYEAEELYRDGHTINKTRLIFVRRTDGAVREPVAARVGQYFGRPVWEDGKIIILLADFPEERIRLLAYCGENDTLETVVTIPGKSVEDCYNLMPVGSPLSLTRQAGNRFQVIWPEQADFEIGSSESFCFRDGDRLYFSKWFEDPDYREEVVVRALNTGEILEQYPGSLMFHPDGQIWLLV